jgi:hypothetical protein
MLDERSAPMDDLVAKARQKQPKLVVDRAVCGNSQYDLTPGTRYDRASEVLVDGVAQNR